MTNHIKHPKTKEEFEKIINSKKPVLIDFYAEWCGPCQMMGPILDQLVSQYKNIDEVEIAKVDIDELRDVALRYNVMSVPTFLIFKNGEIVETMVGVRSQTDLESKLNQLLT